MPTYTTDSIRNVVLLSHSGAGKTSLSEVMLFNTGAISRVGKVDSGNTVSDYEPEEAKRQISVSLSVIPITLQSNKINIIDTPGYPDFVGEVKAGMHVADGAVLLVCAASGVEVGTELMWQYAEESGIPRLAFINKMDRENADFQRTLEELREKFGRVFVPVQLPIGAHSNFKGVIDLIHMKAYTPEEAELPDSLKDEAESMRDKLLEAVAEIDDDLMMKYLEGEEISAEEIYSTLQEGSKAGKAVPVLAGSAMQNAGIPQLLKGICDYIPSPKENKAIEATSGSSQQTEAIEPSPDSPLAAYVFKTTVDPYVGKITCFRTYSGTFPSNSQAWNSNKQQAERVAQISMLRGKTQEGVPEVIAGDIGCLTKLSVTNTGDTLSTESHPLVLPSFELPTPNYVVALYPKTKIDVDKLSTALPRLLEEDPSLEVRREPDTAEILLAGIGDSHIDVSLERLQRKFGVEVEAKPPKVPYKETITVQTNAEYKHKKQTGGHGQYGHVLLELVPSPRGTGFEFAEKVVGGAVPKNYIPAVEKGVTEAQNEGVLAGYPVVDVKVTLYDGSSHPVDSSDMSFKIASSHAFKKGFTQAQPVLLEPIVNLKVIVSDNFTGDIISDLNTKRAKVQGMTPYDGNQLIEAQVPLAEVQRYAVDIRSITQGRGTYSVEFSHYEEVPAHLTQKIVEQRKAEKEQKE